MSDFLIRASDVSLTVPVFQAGDRRLLANPMRFITDLYLGKTTRNVARLLEGISLDLSPGERLGVLGVNGAGKSTLLRLLAGIYRPTTGALVTNGNVKGLFDVTLGMNPDATGLENIYMRGLQMGLGLSEVREKIPEVLDFSELEAVIEKPLGTYSDGMRLRLAVAVSTIRAPDVLLLDEWIGTGDLHFRQKMRSRMDRFIQDSGGLILATHNTDLMRSLCSRGLVLDKGRLVFLGDLDAALGFYETEVRASLA